MPTLAVICSVFIIFCTADNFFPEEPETPDYTYVIKPVMICSETITTSAASTSTVSSSETTVSGGKSTSKKSKSSDKTSKTTAVSETTTQSSEEMITPPADYPSYDYMAAGDSPNSQYYQDRIVIIGDSIAYGFNAYGYIPYEHNIAKESLAVWNMGNYTFDLGGGPMGVDEVPEGWLALDMGEKTINTYSAIIRSAATVIWNGPMGVFDAAGYVNSPLYFISVGMNDLYSYSPDDYAWAMRGIAEEVLARVPDATIVIGAITPVSQGNYYTSNETIQAFNNSLEYVINDMNSPQVMFFNTYAILADPSTQALSSAHSGGDGLHLNGSSYGYVLSCLFNFLDTTSAIDQMAAHDSAY